MTVVSQSQILNLSIYDNMAVVLRLIKHKYQYNCLNATVAWLNDLGTIMPKVVNRSECYKYFDKIGEITTIGLLPWFSAINMIFMLPRHLFINYNQCIIPAYCAAILSSYLNFFLYFFPDISRVHLCITCFRYIRRYWFLIL